MTTNSSLADQALGPKVDIMYGPDDVGAIKAIQALVSKYGVSLELPHQQRGFTWNCYRKQGR